MAIKNTLFIVTVAICIASCEDNTQEKEQLLGQWNFKERVVHDSNNNVLGVYEEDNFYCPLDAYIFKDNGKLEIIDYPVKYNGDQVCTGNGLFGDWSKVNNQLTIQLRDKKSETYTIITKTSKSLVIEQPVPKDVNEQFDNKASTQQLVFIR